MWGSCRRKPGASHDATESRRACCYRSGSGCSARRTRGSAVDHFSDPLPLLGKDLDDARAQNDASIAASRRDNVVGEQRVAGAWQAQVWRERQRTAARLPLPMNTIGGAQRQDVPRHTDTDQVALASDTDDGGDDSSDESFDYDYSDGGLISEPGGGFRKMPLCIQRYVARIQTYFVTVRATQRHYEYMATRAARLRVRAR